MTVQTHTDVRDDLRATTRRASRNSHRVVTGGVVAGAATAAVLSLVILPGETEGVATGSLLVGFAFGWTLIAAGQSWRTGRPQRWASAPAAVMGTTGFALMLASPREPTMTALNWVWPPVLLALVLWVGVTMRRRVTGRSRWLVTAILVVLATTTVGATTANLAERHTRATYSAPGERWSVGDRELHLDCTGQGSPTVVLVSGLGEISASWAWVTEQVGATTRVCAYDRAGQGWSDDVETPQDGVAAADDLHRLLEEAGEQGPFVLAGHSIGGPHALVYADRYPDDVAGLVLLDSTSPEQFTRMSGYRLQHAVMRRGAALFPLLARIGLGPVLGTGSTLPAGADDEVMAMTSTARAQRNGRDEITTIPELLEQAQRVTSLGSRPLVVLTASANLETDGWQGAQDALAALSTDSTHRVVDSSHEGLVLEQGPAAESAQAITQVVEAVRSGALLAP
jgi:pimeloyl-ACP methyl ester carboxylesterase